MRYRSHLHLHKHVVGATALLSQPYAAEGNRQCLSVLRGEPSVVPVDFLMSRFTYCSLPSDSYPMCMCQVLYDACLGTISAIFQCI